MFQFPIELITRLFCKIRYRGWILDVSRWKYWKVPIAPLGNTNKLEHPHLWLQKFGYLAGNYKQEYIKEQRLFNCFIHCCAAHFVRVLRTWKTVCKHIFSLYIMSHWRWIWIQWALYNWKKKKTSMIRSEH